MYRHAKTAGYVYQARLRHEVSEKLGLEWGEVRKGTAELAGFARPVIEHFSRRRAEIVDELARHGTGSLAAGNAAALATRKGKDYGVSFDRLQEDWRARAAEHGLDHDRLRGVLQRTSGRPDQAQAIDLEALTERRSTFTRRDVLQAVAEGGRYGMTAAEIEAVADATLQHDREVVRLDDPAEARYTTRAQLALERGLLDHADARIYARTSVAELPAINEAIEQRPLSAEQARLVRGLCSSGRGIEAVRAPAGAGKTFALDAAREAWQASGVEVVGCALSARAAIELRDQAAIETTTIARLTQTFDHGHQLPARGVLIVDEVGMVGTRDLAKLAEHADQVGAKLVLVGDDRQLPEIEAGGAFRAIAERTGALELTETRRQREAWDRDALRALRDGNVEYWAAAYAERGRLVSGPTAPAVREQLVTDWSVAALEGQDVAMIALRRADVADLNQRARAVMRDHGRLQGDDVRIGERDYAEGDQIVLTRNDRRFDVVNGDRGEITHAASNEVEVQLDRGPTVLLPAHYAAEHLDHGYAITAHKAQGATVDRAFVLGSDDAYREWGYTALSRHRDTSTFYITGSGGFLNQPELPVLESDLAEHAAGLLDTERRQQLALELAGVDRTPTPTDLQALLRDDHEDRSMPSSGDDLEHDLDYGLDLGP